MISYIISYLTSFRLWSFRFDQWLANDKSVMPRLFACRVLGILPILKASACNNTYKDWQRQRRLNLFHRAMDPEMAGSNNLWKNPRYCRWADRMIRLGLAFWRIISLDGLEIAAAALSSTMECPKEELDMTDKLYPVKFTSDVRAGVEKARAERLNRDGTIKDRRIGKVMWYNIISYIISYRISYMISYMIAFL